MNEEVEIQYHFEPLKRLIGDLLDGLKREDARFLVDEYYAIQNMRIAAFGQVRAAGEAGEAHRFLLWYAEQLHFLEKQVKRALERYAKSTEIGERCLSVVGIGPVITAGLLAHFDIEKAPTVGHFWRFAGLDPTLVWEKKTKRPFNAKLKVLCWKIGESFVKVSGKETAVYGLLYKQRKELEQQRNDAGLLANQAAAKLDKYRIGKTTEAYKYYSEGKLPPAHIHARAKRWAVKMFLSHLHEVWYELHFGTPAPAPYTIAIQGHVHRLRPEF